MKLYLCLLGLFICSITYANNSLINTLKERICYLNKDPFFRSREQHRLVSEISNKGNTTDLSLRELYWNTFQPDSDLLVFVNTQEPDGSWKDINYRDDSRSNWRPAIHANRLMYLSRAYSSPTSALYHQRKVSEALHRGINYWFRTQPVCKNWWYNEIAIPRFMGMVFLFIEDELTNDEKLKALQLMNKSGFRMTGQNKVWLAGNVFLKALMTNDMSLVKAARDTIAAEIYISTNEGIQPDFSFHQHGPQQQFGNYGLAFLSSMAYYANVFSNTELAFDSKQLGIIRNYVFDGMNKVVWHGYMDVSACNRQLFKQAQTGKALAFCLAAYQLKQVDNTFTKQYEDILQRNLYPGTSPEEADATHFWRSDLTIFRSQNSYISVRSCSPRVIGTEFTNNENKKGHFISDGFTSIMRRGDEYNDIFPCWDWNRLPGVTAPVLSSTTGQIKDNYKNPNPFVGGLTHCDKGIATFHLNRNNTEAKKSWFYIQQVLVALGTNIKSEDKKELVTGVNQCLLHGKAILEYADASKSIVNDTLIHSSFIKSVWHDSIGYVFPKFMDVSLTLGKQEGDWHDIADPYSSQIVSKNIFKLWINHGLNVSNADYQYIVLPSVSSTDLQKYSKAPKVIILANQPDVQAVKSTNDSVFQAVFHEPRKIFTFSDGGGVELENAGLVMIEKNNNATISLTVADPTQTLRDFRCALNGCFRGAGANYDPKTNQTKICIQLPQHGNAGNSITKIFN